MIRILFPLFLFGASAFAADDIDNTGSFGAGAGAAPQAAAIFTDYTDFTPFQNAFGGPLERIRFNEVPPGTIVTNQYAARQVVFTDGNDFTQASGVFVEDGVGLSGAGRIRIALSQPARAIGAFFPGAMTIELFDVQGGTSLYTSANFAGAGTGHFGGVVSDEGFGFVELRDWTDDTVFIDDLVIGFAPPDGAIRGCIEVSGIPLTLNLVALWQPAEPLQLTVTDAGGCYEFADPVQGKWFSVFILGTRVP